MAIPGNIPILAPDERQWLLKLAREAIAAAANGRRLPRPDLTNLPPVLTQPGACFVTINKDGALRGCTGALVATGPLALEVVRTAAQTATSDPRFNPVRPEELAHLEIEISVLTPPRSLKFDDSADLPKLIQPGVDGVTLYCGPQRATFLPQVWERIPDPRHFLGMLCRKMGLSPEAWKGPGIAVEVYQVVSFCESD